MLSKGIGRWRVSQLSPPAWLISLAVFMTTKRESICSETHWIRATTSEFRAWCVSLHLKYLFFHANTIQLYHPDDLKGKGEPSYTIEKQLKERKRLGDSGTEMTSRRHSKSVGHNDRPRGMPAENPFEPEASTSGIGRSNSGLGNALKKRIRCD